MSTPPSVARIAADRRTGVLDGDACRDALARAGFDDPVAARSALDHLLAAPDVEFDVGVLLEGCVASPDPPRALNNTARLLGERERPRSPVPPDELTWFLGASQHMADLLASRPELLGTLGRWFDPATAGERYLATGARDDAERALRHAQHEDLLAIAWQNLVLDLDVEQTTILLSRLADAVIEGAGRGLGADRHFAVIGLGKLGGLELNYSSDIDLVFVRPEDARDQATADGVARRLVALLGRQTVDGHLYRVDMRLRPEGAAGTLTRTVSSCLQYYRTIGRPWERQMLTKGRAIMESVAGEDGLGAGEAFLQGTRQWTLECGMDAGAVRQFKRLKTATEDRYRTGKGEGTDVKQAPGGIRDVETIAQFLALIHASKNPWLLCNSTLHGLERLRLAGALTSLETARLRRAYLFHRRIENLLQVMHRVQTHRLPVDRKPLTKLMGIKDVATFDEELAEHRTRVRAIFERHFEAAFPQAEGAVERIPHLLMEAEPDEETFEATLRDAGLHRPKASVEVLRRAAKPVSRFLPESPRLVSSFANVLPALLDRLSLTGDADAALDRFERMTRGVGAREILYAQLQEEPELLDMLCHLADGSPLLSEILEHEPQLFDAFMDALLTGVRGRRGRRARLAELHGDPWLALSDYKKLEMLHTGVRDLAGRIDTPAVLSELSHLCIDILRRAYELVLEEALREQGTPQTIRGVSAKVRAHMVVIALGKVGGLEANYGSDADVLFVYSGDGETDRGVANSVFFGHVAGEFMARLGGSRASPRLYKMDARLRPEGNSGPLVTSLRAFETYYRSPRAALFEHQAMLKARVVAGDAELGQKVIASIRNTIRRLTLPPTLAADMRVMRDKIEAKATGHDLKHGTGGMVDIEQLTQFLQLRHAAAEPAVLVQETPRALEMLADHGALAEDEAKWLADTYLFFRRVETRLQIALGLDTKQVPSDAEALRRLGLRMGFADTAEGDAGHILLSELEELTASTRKRYERLVVGDEET